MTEPEVDFQTFVAGSYELRLPAEFKPDSPGPYEATLPFERWYPQVPLLVAVGKPQIVRPKRKALDYAVGLLLKSPIGKFDDEWFAREFENERDVSLLGRNALAIAKHIGLLHTMITGGEPLGRWKHESLREWLTCSAIIRDMFYGKESGKKFPDGRLGFYLLNKPNGLRSVAVRPESTQDALFFHAAQMIAKGTVAQTCENCGTIFLSGGGSPGKDKKREGSRFCSDDCRYKFHNAARRKSR